MIQERAEEFYGEHQVRKFKGGPGISLALMLTSSFIQGKAFFPRLVEFMTSGPLYAMVLGKDDAVKAWRGLMGPTNALTAKEQQPTW